MNEIDDYRRKSDDMLIELATRFNDFTKNYEKSELDRVEWRKKFEEKIDEIENRTKTMLIPYRISLWAFTIIGGGIIVEGTRRFAEFIKDHVHFR